MYLKDGSSFEGSIASEGMNDGKEPPEKPEGSTPRVIGIPIALLTGFAISLICK